MIEVVCTMAILSTVVVSTQVAVQNAMTAATIARDHTVATSLVSTAVYQAEALPYNILQQGVDPSAESLCTDSNISCVTVGGNTSYFLKSTGAAIAACGTMTPESPIAPHQSSVTVGGTVYTVSAYPTVSNSSCSTKPLLVTLVVIVNWRAPTRRGILNQVTAEVGIAAP